jgi:hypothetical protein
MRRFARLVLTVVVVGGGPILSACSSFDLDDYAFWDSKKKLPGDRKPVFPEGVPGVTAGVPPDLVRGYREPEGALQSDPAKAAAEAAAAAQETKPKAKPAPPQRVVSKPPPKPQAPPDPYAAAAPKRTAAPAPAAVQPAPQATAQPAPQAGGAPWPSAQPQAAWPGAPGTVTR